MLPSLYVLTSDQVVSYADWPTTVDKILQSGVELIQLREKTLSDESLLPLALQIQELCKAYNALLIINDRVQLANKIKADGVHLGKNDNSIRHARQFLGSKYLIGASCYRKIYSALKAQRDGANYVAFGSIFPSSTKKTAPRCTLTTLRQAKQTLSLPVCAIGGIRPANLDPILSTGVDMLAISDAVFNSSRPDLATNKIMQRVIMSRHYPSKNHSGLG